MKGHAPKLANYREVLAILSKEIQDYVNASRRPEVGNFEEKASAETFQIQSKKTAQMDGVIPTDKMGFQISRN